MKSDEESDEAHLGWVILTPEAVPDRWRARAMQMVLVPLTPAESRTLLSGEPVVHDTARADLDLARFLARGHSGAEISRALGLSLRTVNRRVARLRQEFGVTTTQELATELARRGFG